MTKAYLALWFWSSENFAPSTVSQKQGNAKAFWTWNEWQEGLHVLCLCMQATTFLLTNRQKGAIGKNDLCMKNLFTLRFMLVSLFAIMSMAVSAGIIEYSTDGFKYKLDTEAKTAELAQYNGSATEVSISEGVTCEGVVYSVTSLGEYCFCACKSLTSINIPSSVTSLGKACFYQCSSLTSINIPSSVTSLGYACFGGCSSLTSIVVDAENSVYDSRENCNAIIETKSNTMICGCAGTVIPSSVTGLGDGCFYECSLTSINIPSSVTGLGHGCFLGCSSLTSVNIPSSVRYLGDGCLRECSSLTSINIPSSVTSLGSRCFGECN